MPSCGTTRAAVVAASTSNARNAVVLQNQPLCMLWDCTQWHEMQLVYYMLQGYVAESERAEQWHLCSMACYLSSALMVASIGCVCLVWSQHCTADTEPILRTAFWVDSVVVCSAYMHLLVVVD
jgi:hypothetical protein